MHFSRARLAKQPDDASARRSANDGVVDKYDALPFHDALYRGKLDLYLVQTVVGGDERPSDIFVFDKPDAVGNPRRSAKTERRVQPRIGYADDQVGLRGVGIRQNFPRFYSCVVYGNAVDHLIGTGKIDILENTEFLRLFIAMFFLSR